MFQVKSLNKSFQGKTIIKDMNLDVADNEILSIVGPSGAGKTTLLRCITGLEKADSGKFFLDGEEIDPTDDSKSVIGVVFQDFGLFPNLTVIENIILAPQLVLKKSKEEALKEAQELIDKLDLTGKESLYPYQLSGGQKQRVAIVRTLAMHPKIICYDEPTSALDPKLSEEVGKIILDLKKQNITQLVVTHDVAFANQVADKVKEVRPFKEEG
ncbi:Glutamine transport ATP-binding protein GlnQ [Apilactobacillus kunkeei]|uniref:Polar amino acid ABC transporter ATP-binding protein n=1 Tax=Apilactobacillus kunkeei TaxID=148814 RepID=A0AAC8WD65_9LACO|nr:ATP-binding cassette domain-containing protein [Apilactobacillus kunkeei]ALJ32049.1 polar amino acid ABC transporter ATP-binding protein [Apilactobacillus kunkeei]KFJ14875.1 polar amino acid ABC transporter ATPase [Apilactobacillus kunkeei]KOY71649.1 ABC superfamily ATP binding cassette transporter, ABC protein [Apilactobacillus kunkeei]KOY74995.1 ABC superfamily ATP binding cassette transporter, ABC protein [Apilactobacillus kunkeei]NBI00030.1 amino acid ABC transporter ATP-binding protein